MARIEEPGQDVERMVGRGREETTPLYLLSVALLALTLVIGKGAGTAASTKSWLAIGSHRIGQPSEIAKVTVVLMLAKVLSARRETAPAAAAAGAARQRPRAHRHSRRPHSRTLQRHPRTRTWRRPKSSCIRIRADRQVRFPSCALMSKNIWPVSRFLRRTRRM